MSLDLTISGFYEQLQIVRNTYYNYSVDYISKWVVAVSIQSFTNLYTYVAINRLNS